MAKRKFTKVPAFQFYPADYLSDAKTRAMTFAQRGMYWDLICYCWIEGMLPDNPSVIAHIIGTPCRRFVKHDWPIIERCFRRVAGEGYRHPRLEKERLKQRTFREAQSMAGLKGAAKRWAKRAVLKMGSPSFQNGVAIVLPSQKNGSSSSSSSSSSELKKRDFVAEVREWCQHPNGCPNRQYHEHKVLMEKRNV